MENILKDVNTIIGVTGSFVCDDEGRILAKALPAIFDKDLLSPVSRTMVQTIAGLELSRRRKVGNIDLTYDQGRLIIKNLDEGCLCILCVRRINVPLLNLTANVAARKLRQKMKEVKASQAAALPQKPEPVPEPEPEPEPELEPVRRMTRAEVMAASLRSNR